MLLVVDHTDSIAGAVAHTVHTTARIGGGPPGLMVATSVFQSNNWLTGFKAAAVVTLLDGNKKILASTNPQHGWADGTVIGTHVNTVTWTYQFAPNIANQAAGIAVLHLPDENYLSNISGFFDKFGKQIVDIIKKLQGGHTDGPAPYDPSSETGGGGGEVGTIEDPGSETGDGGGGVNTTEGAVWAKAGAPWSNYAAKRAGKPPAVGTATAVPNEFHYGVPANITVRATDSVTKAPINGVVYVGARAVGHTGVPFNFTWNTTFHATVDPRTHQRILAPLTTPLMTVRAEGYQPISVPVTVKGSKVPAD
jgi:hypothetical protein